MSWTLVGVAEITCAALLSIMGTSTCVSTVPITVFLEPVNIAIPVSLTLALPCFPGLLFSTSTTLQGSPSMMM